MTIPFYCALQKYRVLALTHIGLPQLHNKITLLREAQLDQFSLVGIETGGTRYVLLTVLMSSEIGEMQ